MMDKLVRNLSIALVLLIILTPLGLLAVGETFGEWSTEEIEEKLWLSLHPLRSARRFMAPPGT